EDAIASLCADASAPGEPCEIANDNGGGQIVVSGAAAAVARAVELAPGRGAKRAIPLQVSAPFHCSLMQPAADRMREALAAADLKTPAVPLVANVLASAISDPGEIRRRLVEQVTGQVRWRESVSFMAANGVGRMLEVGSGKVLAGLSKRIDKALTVVSVGAPEDVEAALGG
ncbi:MAG: ACP S-malonyltransferase, partial [Rhizobiaceae bacterium]|nr:ACP S-malonyltransferase [Rhizobiaceae bacterium]